MAIRVGLREEVSWQGAERTKLVLVTMLALVATELALVGIVMMEVEPVVVVTVMTEVVSVAKVLGWCSG